MFDLARLAVLSLSGMSRLVDRLVREGLVERQRAAEDGRGSYVTLTAIGQERFAAAHATHLDGIRRLFLARLVPGDLQALAACWERLVPGIAARVRTVPPADT